MESQSRVVGNDCTLGQFGGDEIGVDVVLSLQVHIRVYCVEIPPDAHDPSCGQKVAQKRLLSSGTWAYALFCSDGNIRQ